ncbi:MAG: hypothetical protein HY762_08880 [Planctomycetes bacterium]|nr:hypothetical protein [Planctomycetota bacterium]
MESNKPKPVPVALAMIICDTFMEDRFTGKKSLVGIFNNIASAELPCRHPSMNVFCVLTEGIGQYEACLRCTHTESNQTVINIKGPLPFPNPLATVEFNFELKNVAFPKEGQYIFELLCNDQIVISRKFTVSKMEPKPKPPGETNKNL